MTSAGDAKDSTSRLVQRIEQALKQVPCSGDRVAVARTPGVVDVMGGIGEESGGLVLTATTALSYHIAVWPTEGHEVRIRMFSKENERVFDCESGLLDADSNAAIWQHCCERDAAWAAPVLLTLRHARKSESLSVPTGGLCFVIQTDFPDDIDLGREAVLTAATLDVLARLCGVEADSRVLSAMGGRVLADMDGLTEERKILTALCAPAEGSLMQLRFHPQLLCEVLELPSQVTIKAVATRLSRPTTMERMRETRTCSDMGHRMILDLQRADGFSADPDSSRLASITPAEYVERYRDRMPSKITRKAFVDRYGELRGLDHDGNPKDVYKIRSRAEHHIYENRRVHDFATNIVRARRNGVEALVTAGELMYASHWSHSQRCGIGGVETDRLVNLIRKHGPAAGLYGAKVTSGGQGGELAVLMRDDATAHAALDEAVKSAREESSQPVHVFSGSLPGANAYEAPELPFNLNSAGV